MSRQVIDLKTVWQTALGDLEVALSKPNFITWFKDTTILTIEDEIVHIGVPNSFVLTWLSNKFHKDIFVVLQKILRETPIRALQFEIVRSATPTATKTKLGRLPIDLTSQASLVDQTPSVDRSDATRMTTSLNTNYIFENFIVGTHNRLAHAASLAVAANPGSHHNPLVIYGGVGLGKTHLLHAVGNQILADHPKKRILYASCEQFATEYVHAIQTRSMDHFKKRYRDADVLLIDDIQFLSGKEGTQEEFFHTFNSLHQNGRQIVLTSDRTPQAIPELENRLSSRIIWGMVTDIKSPDVETRAAILTQKCRDRGQQLDQDVIELLAKTFQSNIRELEGALNQVLAYCELEASVPTLSVVEDIIKNQYTETRLSVTSDQILKLISGYYQIGHQDLLGKRRNKEFVYPRQIAMYLLRYELSFSYPQIGREFQKDHTTVMHGVDKIEKELRKNPRLQHDMSHLKDRLYHHAAG